MVVAHGFDVREFAPSLDRRRYIRNLAPPFNNYGPSLALPRPAAGEPLPAAAQVRGRRPQQLWRRYASAAIQESLTATSRPPWCLVGWVLETRPSQSIGQGRYS